MISRKEKRFCDETGLGFNPCSSACKLSDLGQISLFFPNLGRGVTPMTQVVVKLL